jgi:hypothetical protein
MKIYAVKVESKTGFGYEDEVIEFCTTEEIAKKVIEEEKECFAEFNNELYIEEIYVRED